MDRLNEIATRKAELKAMLEGEEQQDLEAIERELNELEVEEKSINEQVEVETRKAQEEAELRKEEAEKINRGEVKPTVIEIKKEEKGMEEIRNSKEYIDAYARYVQTGDDKEVRTLLTENVNGTVAVPELVYEVVKTAWDKEGIMALVRKAELKGNVKVNFEISSNGAVKHLEGSQAVAEEELVLGIASLVPASIKKWVGISDEVYDMRGEAFVRYIYDELTQKIAKKCADELVAIITGLSTSATSTACSITQVTKAPAQDTVASALGTLSDEANNPVIIMNKLTWSAFKKAQYDGNYSTDIFENLPVVFNNTLPAYSSADASACYMIVGDLQNGALANFPNGMGNIDIKFDDKTLMTSDVIRILGREYVGMNVIACKHFCQVLKPSASI